MLARLRDFAETEVLPRMRAVAPDAAIATEEKVTVPALAADPGSPAETLALALTGHNHCVGVPFTSEAGLFQRAGIPAVLCGPGSAAQAHQPDEFVTVEQMELVHRLPPPPRPLGGTPLKRRGGLSPPCGRLQ